MNARRTRPARRPMAVVLAIAVSVTVAGCSGPATHPPASTSFSRSAATSATPAGTFTNPVSDSNFPDPAVVQVTGGYVAYATGGNESNIQTMTSPDLVHWRPGTDALPQLGRWADTGNTWAPEVIASRGTYLMFYVAHDTSSGKQCIGRAESRAPSGPFLDQRDTPLICQAKLGGSIDPNVVRTQDGRSYLYWKNDGNCCGQPVNLWGQALAADLRSVTGTPSRLLTNTQSWQGNLVEAPEMVQHDRGFYLFYSANDYASDKYAVGYATCRTALGPCQDQSVTRPLLATTSAAAGPGHCYIVTLTDRSTWMFFHAWQPDSIGSVAPGRQLWLGRLTWTGGRPVIAPPTSTPSAVPHPS